jgi:hypothetical protein
MADNNSSTPSNWSDRLVKIEVLLEQVLSELKKGDAKFEKMDLRFEKTETKIHQLERQQSYWQGALAILAIVWTVILKWFI